MPSRPSEISLSLAPVLQELGVHLVGVSPQAPGKLVAIKRRHGFQFQIASDGEATLIHEFGIGFAAAEEDREKQRLLGRDIGAILGTGKWEFPFPTALVIDQDRVVRNRRFLENRWERTIAEISRLGCAKRRVVGALRRC
jgi:peroxiredoxin